MIISVKEFYMASYTSWTIKELIDDIENGSLILPALQRDYVWSQDKICDLFDSIIRDYPIGTFLFWAVDSDQVKQYVFNDFIKDYKESNGGLHRGEPVDCGRRSDYRAVLDGQQRITSIYLGLKGKYTVHKKSCKWDQPSSFYDTFLCLDLFHTPSEDNNHYHFSFVTQEKISKITKNTKTNTDELWVPVGDMFNRDVRASKYINNLEHQCGTIEVAKREKAEDMLDDLKKALFSSLAINYYCEREKSLSEVVDVFVKVNSGGEKLSASDLMLSIATGGTENEDIHTKFQSAIEDINGSVNQETGFKVDKNILLTAGLMFTGAESLALSKKENYEPARIKLIMDNWEKLTDALKLAVRFIEEIGFQGNYLTSKNLILPVSYYFYYNNIGESHLQGTSLRARRDRVYIRQWMLRAMITSLFSDGITKTLKDLKNIIKETSSTKQYFPLDTFLRKDARTRPITVSPENVDEILKYRKGDGRIQPLLIEICEIDPSNTYDVDHIWPRVKLTSPRELNRLAASLTDTERQQFKLRCNDLPNLQLLPHRVNLEKNDQLYNEWIEKVHPNKTDDYYSKNCIPQDMEDYSFIRFIDFYDKREKLLRDKIEKALPSSFDEINARYALGDPNIS